MNNRVCAGTIQRLLGLPVYSDLTVSTVVSFNWPVADQYQCAALSFFTNIIPCLLHLFMCLSHMATAKHFSPLIILQCKFPPWKPCFKSWWNVLKKSCLEHNKHDGFSSVRLFKFWGDGGTSFVAPNKKFFLPASNSPICLSKRVLFLCTFPSHPLTLCHLNNCFFIYKLLSLLSCRCSVPRLLWWV